MTRAELDAALSEREAQARRAAPGKDVPPTAWERRREAIRALGRSWAER